MLLFVRGTRHGTEFTKEVIKFMVASRARYAILYLG